MIGVKSNNIYTLVVLTIAIYILILTGPSLGHANAETGIVSGSVVNIRSGAGTQYDIAGTLYKDTRIEILSKTGEWYKVQYGTVSGWMHQSLLSKNTADIYLTVKEDLVNLRSGPGTANNKIGEARKGDRLVLLDVAGDWNKVKTSIGQVAYIRSDMVGEENMSGTVVPVLAPITPIASPTPATGLSKPIIMLDGKLMEFEVSPRIENNRILVPLRAVFEAMGATVVWNQTTLTATATKGDVTVILPLNSTKPTVNGIVWELDVPAMVVNQRTLAPLRFVGEALGGTATWVAASGTVILQSPTKNEFPAVAVTISKDLVNLRSGPSVNYGSVDSALVGERLAVLGEQNGWYQVSRGSRTAWVAGWVVDIIRENEESVPSPSVVTMPTEPVAKIDGLRLSSLSDSSGLKVIMESGAKMETKIVKTANKISYEFADVQINGTSSIEIPLGTEIIKVQGRNQGKNAVVEIQFPVEIEYRTSTEEEGKKEVFNILNFITGVQRNTFGGSGERITISSNAPLAYTSSQTETRLQVVFSDILPGKALSNYKYDDSRLISSLNFQQKTVDSQKQMELTLITKKSAKFSIGPSSDGTGLNILFIDQSEIQERVPMVVLNAGHGGKDTGARGDNLNEKDVNLDVTLKVGQYLTQKGIKVEYTRIDDTYMSPAEEPIVANLYNAALFVAIHCNSTTSPDPSGTETYYYAPLGVPELYMQKDERNKLATKLQQSLIDKLGRIDRGVKQSNFAVLRNTLMPSALVELAFLSNPTECQLLKQQSFRQLAAQAIADGIEAYMKENIKI